MDYNFREVEKKWRKYWDDNKTYKTDIEPGKPKFYVLDMFPYPSGAGLHVGHPLGYIASDIYSRYKRQKGFNVLHPMGYDAYGLPAEQYAIQTGQHPAITTERNIIRYREQLDKLGFSYDWDREVRTCEPDYYKWTQWTFIQLFNHFYNNKTRKAEPISQLVAEFEIHGNTLADAACDLVPAFNGDQWKQMSEAEQQQVLMNYRLAYLSDTMVNWCPALGTVLANDEVKEGFSVRGGHPVERKKMQQWFLRITAYADRLLEGLERIDWSESIKEIQRNWIGRSEGATIFFGIKGVESSIEVFTTRPDTIFGATFMVLAPEHELVKQITTPEFALAVDQYVTMAGRRSDRERMAEVKTVSGQFTGAYAVHPFSGKPMPIYIADYVLAGYGTGAIMAVPAHDSRDYAFAKHFGLDIVEVVTGGNIEEGSYDAKEGTMINSDFINGLEVKEAISTVIARLEKLGIGTGRINFRLRDAIFSRQRYWGEPFPVYYKDGIPYVLDESELPLELPEVDKYLPTETGEPPLARAIGWQTKEGYPLERNTMPGFAGSSAYYIRYMDPHNDQALVSKKAVEYWQNVDLYVGGAEHATGHLIYSRFWNKFLFDIGIVIKDEPFKKLINQGMIQGRSNFVYRINPEKMAEHVLWEQLRDKKMGVDFVRNFRDGRRVFDFFSPEANLIIEVKKTESLEKLVEPYEEYIAEKGYKMLLIPIGDFLEHRDEITQRIKDAISGKEVSTFVEREALEQFQAFVTKNFPGREHFSDPIHVDIGLVHNDILDIEAFRNWQPHLANARFVLEDGKYVCGWEIEKMSKSLHNVQNPDELIDRYGADTLRLYEMFLGPIEQAKPWDTNGIEGVFRFIRKLWRLYNSQNNEWFISEEPANDKEKKVLHKTLKKVGEDIEKFSFNTAVSTFMICVKELGDLGCNKREILEPLAIMVSSFAPHLGEELWHQLGHDQSVAVAKFPDWEEKYVADEMITYPVQFNGKTRLKIELPAESSKEQVEAAVLAAPGAAKWLEGKTPKKVIVVPGKIVNVVI